MNKMPLQIQVLTNLNCNLACTYCYENKGRGANSLASMKNFITARYGELETGEDRDVNLDFIGGESLMYPENLDKLCAHAALLHREKDIKGSLYISTSTNSTLIAEDEKVQRFLRKWKPALGFSIDGTKALHDQCRITPEGQPSYDRAVAGYKWVRENIPCIYTGVKATYTHATIDQYADGLINLIGLGFTDIAANVVFEELWDKEKDAMRIARQMVKVVDYLFDNNLEDKINIFQINNKDLDMKNYIADTGPKDQNHCGTCTHMRCIGFDDKIYGCNRFCTMKKEMPIGTLRDEKIVISKAGEALAEEVSHQYDDWPDECKECPYGKQCPSCSAIPYEQDGPVKFFGRKPQCGFTHALVLARMYFKKRLLETETEQSK